MADTKLSALASATPTVTDEMYFLDDPAGTPLDRNTTVAALLATGPALGAGTPSATAKTPDFIGQYYFDTVGSRLYISDATASPADFNLVGVASTGALTVTGTGSGISKGDVLSGTTAALSLADSDAESTSQVIGIANEAISTSGEVVVFGLVTGVDTSSFAAGDILYVGPTAGTMVNTPPASGFVAEVGTVMVSDLSGSILVNPKLYGSATVTNETYIHAQSLSPAATNGPEATTVTYATGGHERAVLAFDATTSETAYIDIKLPNGWDEGTLTFTPYWSHPATTTNFGVVWEMSVTAFSNDESLDTAFAGTAVTSSDTGGTTDDLYIGPTSSALTVDGTAAEGDLLSIEIARLPANGSDTMAVDARLHGIAIQWTRNQVDDA